MDYQTKKTIFLNTVNKQYALYSEFPEISQVKDEDMQVIISLYEQESLAKGIDPWKNVSALQMQKCIYEVIGNNPSYEVVTNKNKEVFEKNLESSREYIITYGQDEYTEKGEYSYAQVNISDFSITLAEMQLKEAIKTGSEYEITKYEKIKNDFIKSGNPLPQKFEELEKQALESSKKTKEEKEKTSAAEQTQDEIKMIELQQKINEIENEKLEIAKSLKILFSKLDADSGIVAMNHPEEWNNLRQCMNKLNFDLTKASEIKDLKEKFQKITEEINSYKTNLAFAEASYQEILDRRKVKEEKSTVTIEKARDDRIAKPKNFGPFNTNVNPTPTSPASVQSTPQTPEDNTPQSISPVSVAKDNTTVNPVSPSVQENNSPMQTPLRGNPIPPAINKSTLIDNVINAMMYVTNMEEEFGTDIANNLKESTRKRLESKSIEELEDILMTYITESQIKSSGGMKR